MAVSSDPFLGGLAAYRAWLSDYNQATELRPERIPKISDVAAAQTPESLDRLELECLEALEYLEVQTAKLLGFEEFLAGRLDMLRGQVTLAAGRAGAQGYDQRKSAADTDIRVITAQLDLGTVRSRRYVLERIARNVEKTLERVRRKLAC